MDIVGVEQNAPVRGHADSQGRLRRAIVQTVAYSDIFDYPLTPDEIHRYLIGEHVSREEVISLLQHGLANSDELSERDGYYMLPGREAIVAVRRERERRARDVWQRTLGYGRLIASLPFARMVAVTGELAMDNVQPQSDIDFFVVTEHRRLWLCRVMIVCLVRLAALRGDVLCPNYLLSERALALDERDLYTAHEIAQMVPLTGLDTYWRFRRLNRWVYDFLPNAVSAPRQLQARPHARPLRALAESGLRTRLGGLLEGWERERKMRKFSALAGGHNEASFAADWCKGHMHDHGRLILQAFASRYSDAEEPAR
jgi:hypothetical protein